MIARERMANYWESVSGLPYAFVNGVDGGDIRETNGPAPLTVNVQNLVVSDLSAEKGTVDYFKYDPNPSSPFHRPSISFTVEDTLEAGHHYEYNIFVQPTTNSGFAVLQKEGAYSWLVGNFATPDKMTVTWYGSRFPDYTQDTAGWGTYTYDVGVIEYDQSGNIVDWFNSKWPYCLSVGDHDVWWNFSGDSAKLKTNYILHDYANKNNFSIQRLPVEVSITAIDGSMNEVNNMQIDKEIDHFYNGNTGEGITSFECKESDVDWSNRVIYTAIDDCWKFYRRDHEAVVMLAQNRVVSYILALNYVGRNKFDWAGLLLAEYWINGGGVARNIINDPYWSAYIKAKKKIQNFCHQQLLETEELNNCSLHNQSHTHTNKYIYGASLGTGDTYFGYDVLGEAGHALHYGGNLSINGQNYDANLWYTWHDMMDLHPNVFKNGYGTDIPRWIFGGCIGAQYYELKITWYDDSTFQIITDQAGAKRLWPLSGWLRANINSPYQAQLDQNIAALEDTKWQAYQTLIYKWTQSVLAILPCKSTTYYELILSPPGYDIFDYKYGRFVFGKVKTGLSIISDDGTTMILREGYPVNSDINTIRKEYTIPSFPSPLAVP